MVFRKVNRKLLAEVVFTSATMQKKYIDIPIHLPDKRTIIGNLPISDGGEVVKVHLTNMPILPRESIIDLMTQVTNKYGHLLECGIYIDHGWFTGSTYV